MESFDQRCRPTTWPSGGRLLLEHRETSWRVGSLSKRGGIVDNVFIRRFKTKQFRIDKRPHRRKVQCAKNSIVRTSPVATRRVLGGWT